MFAQYDCDLFEFIETLFWFTDFFLLLWMLLFLLHSYNSFGPIDWIEWNCIHDQWSIYSLILKSDWLECFEEYTKLLRTLIWVIPFHLFRRKQFDILFEICEDPNQIAGQRKHKWKISLPMSHSVSIVFAQFSIHHGWSTQDIGVLQGGNQIPVHRNRNLYTSYYSSRHNTQWYLACYLQMLLLQYPRSTPNLQ